MKIMDTKNYNRATKFFRDMQFADAYDDRWGKFADAMDEMISTCVPVVRCKDCKNLGYTNSHWFCKWLNRCVDEDWFCADGEAK